MCRSLGRALAGLRQAAARFGRDFSESFPEAVTRLQASARQGEAFSSALEDFRTEVQALLTEVQLKPSPIIREDLPVTAAAEDAAPLAANMLVIVNQSEVLFGFVPSVRLTALYDLETHSAGEPMLPKSKRIKLPTTCKPYMRHIGEVTEAFEQAIGDRRSISVAIGAAVGLPSHVLGRVLSSLRKAGIENARLLGNGKDGSTRMAPVLVAAGKKDENSTPSRLQLRIRLGGYTIKVGLGNKEDIPRIRTDDGFLFDFKTLLEKAGKRKVRTAEISFMGDVATETLVATVFGLAPRAEEVQIFIPQ